MTSSTEKPDFTAMKGKELVAQFNQYSGKNRTSSFQNTAEGVKACEAAYTRYLETGVADKPTKPAKVAAKASAKSEKKSKSAKPAKAAKAKVAKPAKANGGARSPKRSLEAKIVILAPQNPRREGSNAFAHFAKMQKSKTVADYLGKFEEGDERRIASQWLWNTKRDGHISISE